MNDTPPWVLWLFVVMVACFAVYLVGIPGVVGLFTGQFEAHGLSRAAPDLRYGGVQGHLFGLLYVVLCIVIIGAAFLGARWLIDQD